MADGLYKNASELYETNNYNFYMKAQWEVRSWTKETFLSKFSLFFIWSLFIEDHELIFAETKKCQRSLDLKKIAEI